MESGEETELRMSCCVRGYDGYQRVREAAVGESLECERETRNEKDRNVVVEENAETTIRCNETFGCLIFTVSFDHEILTTAKISRIAVAKRSSLKAFCTPLLCFSGGCSYTLCTGGHFKRAPSLTKKYYRTS